MKGKLEATKLPQRIIKIGSSEFKLSRGFIDPKGWRQISKTYPEYKRPNFYAFRPTDVPVVLRCVTSENKLFYKNTVGEILEVAGLFEALEKSMKRQGLSKEDFMVGIKPNWMMAITKEEPHVWTNSYLVECITEVLLDKGYKNIAIFESDNMYSGFIENHTVSTVLRNIIEVDFEKYKNKGIEIVNLTEEARKDGVYLINTRKMGRYPVAPTLKRMNFLINVPKLKTHPWSGVTLSFKNMHGANFFSDKFNYLHGNAIFDLFRYHARFWFDPTFELNVNPELEYTKDMFTIVDAEYGLDGLAAAKSLYAYFMGRRLKSPFTSEYIRWATLRRPGKLIASRDPFKLEIATMLLMNYNLKQLMLNPFIKSMVHVVSGLPSEIRIDDNGKNEFKPFYGFNTIGNLEAVYTTLFGKRAEKLTWDSRLITNIIVKIANFEDGFYPALNIFGWLLSGSDPQFGLKEWRTFKRELLKETRNWWERNLADKRKIKAQGIQNFIYAEDIIKLKK